MSPLLAWSFAALFLFAQTLAGAHFHEQSDDAGVSSACVFCVVGSQLDDANASDANPPLATPMVLSRWLSVETHIAQRFAANANARAPPVT